MEDSELQAIRAARLAELQKQSQPQEGSQESAAQETISSILTPGARERLSRIRLVRPEQATLVQQQLTRMAQTGQIRSQVTEDQLVALLSSLNRSNQKTKIVFSRKTTESDSDDDWN